MLSQQYSSNANTTSGSTIETSASVVHRADGTLTFVPGLGTDGKGILVAIGGATETKFVDNSVLDIYDIGARGWTKQSTLGDTIGSRINHCAVRASAKVDGVLTHQVRCFFQGPFVRMRRSSTPSPRTRPHRSSSTEDKSSTNPIATVPCTTSRS